MTVVLYALTYFALAIFVIAVIVRFRMWSKMPMHVRWELYPVAGDAKRAHYGGSYLEDVDWWKKPYEKSVWGELKVMIPEILFLQAVKENNPKLWLRSFPFHFGLYMVIGATALMMFVGILAAVSPGLVAGAFGSFLQKVVMGLGIGGLVSGLVGALGLLERRLNDPDLKDFTAPADIFNLLFFIAAFGVAMVHVVMVDRNFHLSMAFVQGLVTFKLSAVSVAVSSPLTIATVLLLSALVAYIPLTHMSHFIGKYFAYHSIRWNDEPNIRGSHFEKPIQEQLGYKVSWAAPHIDGKGEKNWVDIATEEQKK